MCALFFTCLGTQAAHVESMQGANTTNSFFVTRQQSDLTDFYLNENSNSFSYEKASNLDLDVARKSYNRPLKPLLCWATESIPHGQANSVSVTNRQQYLNRLVLSNRFTYFYPTAFSPIKRYVAWNYPDYCQLSRSYKHAPLLSRYSSILSTLNTPSLLTVSIYSPIFFLRGGVFPHFVRKFGSPRKSWF
jgi:hypothetical protein